MFRKVVLFLQLIISINLFAQIQNKPVAKVANKDITAEEFRLRFEFSPFINKNSDPDSIKYHFLFSLIAEKLFSIEARNKGFEQSNKFEFAFKPVEKLYVRDALFNKEVKSKVDVTQIDIIRGIARYNLKLDLEVFSSTDSNQIKKIISELESGIPIDSLSEIDERQAWLITLGTLKDEELENALYSLDMGEFTGPIKTELGWFLFYLKDKTKNDVSDRAKSESSQVEEIIRDRRTEKAYKNFLNKVFIGKTIEADKKLFIALSEKVYDVLNRKNDPTLDSTKIHLDEADFEKIKKELGNETLGKTFFTVEDTPIQLKDFIGDLFLEGFSVNTADKNAVFNKMSSLVKSFIEKEYLTNLGYKQGLQNLPEVKEHLEMWKDNYLAQLYKNTFTDSARSTSEEVYSYFLEQQKSEQVKAVNIVELLTDSLEIIEHVLNQIEQGKDFKQLALKYTKREWTKDQGGEFGFFPVTMFDEIGRKADEMEIGEIYGPLKVEEGYSIFQLINVKETSDSLFKSFIEVEDQMRSSLFYEKMNKILTDKTIELANKYKINIDGEVLNSINTTNIKMFVQRLMGFGGKIAAVPFTTHWYQWVRELEMNKLFP